MDVDAGRVQSLDRALALLDALARADAPLGIADLADRTGLAAGTAHRLLRGLQQNGFVRRDGARKYAVGAAAMRLGEAAVHSLALAGRPYLADLVARCGESANLAVLEGDDVVYVAQVPSPHSLRMFAEVGRHVAPHTTAVGKVLLAGLPDERMGALLRRTGLPAATEHTITDRDRLADELEAVRERGWASDEGEQETGVRCVAAPVGIAADGRDEPDVVAGISVSGPAGRFPGAADDALVARIRQVAADFGAALTGARAG